MDNTQFEDIWNQGCFVLDTCTLDYISRCEFEYAKSIMDIFLFCSERIFIPSQVASEMKPYFERNIIHNYVDGHIKKLETEIFKINSQGNNDKTIRSKTKGQVQKTMNILKKYSFGLYANELEKLNRKYSRQRDVKFPSLESVIEQAEREIDIIYKDKTVKKFLKIIMQNTFIGLSDNEKNELNTEFKDRLEKRLPPGLGDKGKTTNAFGDLIIWKEILKNIKLTSMKYFLFITEDKKKENNWYDMDGLNIHPKLREEVINTVRYDAVFITDLYHYVQLSKPFVNTDIDVLCKYLINHNKQLKDELEKYFEEDGRELLMEEISNVIRSQYDGDWAIPYSYDVDIIDLEYEIDEDGNVVRVSFDYEIEGNAEACYHCDSEDNMFDAEIYVSGSAISNIPILNGVYSNSLMLKYKNIDICIKDELVVDTSDPLERDEEDNEEEYYEENEFDDEDWNRF